MSEAPFEPRYGTSVLLVVFGVSLTALGCARGRPDSGLRPATAGAAERQSAEPAAPSTASAPKPHVAKARSWHVREDSPFTLVAEGLRAATVAVIDSTPILYAEPCGVPGPAQPFDDRRPLSLSVHALAGDRFSEPLPASPEVPPVHGSTTALGHWPADFWFRFHLSSQEAGAQYRFVHWDGRTWQALPTGASTIKGLEPYQIFDWYDGSKLVAQLQKWHESVSYTVQPCVVWGQTTHVPPDFSALPFPRDLRHELQHTQVQYAMLPSHGVLALHRLSTEDARGAERVTITAAYSTPSGGTALDHVLDAPGGSLSELASGRLGPRDVVVAWGDLQRSDQHLPWLQLYDGQSSAKLPVPDAADRKAPLLAVWFAGGRLWARRGYPATLWQFDGTSWQRFAQVESELTLAASVQDGSLWGANGTELSRFEPDGTRVRVPFLAEPTKAIVNVRLIVTAPGDVWLVASTPDEDLVYRSRKMAGILACD